MQSQSRGRWQPEAGPRLGPIAVAMLTGCSAAADAPVSGPASAWAWPLGMLAAFGCGWLAQRLRAGRRLHAARSVAAGLQRLQPAWTWATDASHRLQYWRGPAQALRTECEFFAASDPVGAAATLARCLATRQPFSQLRLSCVRPVDGSATWRFDGIACHDDSGEFTGYIGSATPCDADDALHVSAAALTPLLAVCPAPALLAVAPAGSDAWQLLACNAAAQLLWPKFDVGVALDEQWLKSLPGLPPGLDAAAASLRPGTGVDLQGWRATLLDALPGDIRGLLLTGPAPAATVPATAESDSFSFTVSHDLRAPIRVVEGFTRIVKEDYGRLLDRVGNDHLDRVLGAAARMNLMIDALLTLARLSTQPLARQPVNLSLLAQYVIDDLRRSAPDREVEVEIEPGLGTQGDPTLLRLVLENLLGNAWKYTARSARAQLSLRSVPHDQGRAFVVRDNGAGFDMRSADRLFGLFQRLHSASDFPGTGVGLASVKRIVQRHGGHIWAEAEQGRGAAFFFTLGG